MNRQAFVRYNTSALRQIAQQGTPSQKEWLRAALAASGTDPQAADLLRRIQ